jgi:hypothetical protein
MSVLACKTVTHACVNEAPLKQDELEAHRTPKLTR